MEFWTFGDSFAATANHSVDWFSILCKQFIGKRYYNNYCDARDVQTIMDSFYKNLSNVKSDSLVVIWLPSLARIRYPKDPKYFSQSLESSFDTNEFEESGRPVNFDVSEYFIHFPYYQYPNGKAKPELDFPFKYFDLNKIDSGYVTYTYHDKENQESLKRIVNEDIDSIKPIDFCKFIQTSTASVENWNKIFESLKNFCNFEILFVSWTDEYNIENVVGRTQLTKEIGFWHTKHQEFEETNGKSGLEYDEHFSTKMNKSFSEWIIKKYPKYFNQ